MSESTTKKSGSPELMRSCLDEAMAEAPGLIMRWCNALGDVLRQQESWTANPTAKAQLLEAKKALDQSKTAWMGRWPDEWRQTIAESMRKRRDGDLPKRSMVSLSFDDLELMDETQIHSTVQAARIGQAVEGDTGGVLSELTALLSGVQGFDSNRPDNNPLRPDVAIEALHRAMTGLTRDVTTRTLWLTHGSEPLGQELQILYRQLVHWLTQKGVKPADYKLIQTASISNLPRTGGARNRPIGLADQEDLVTHQAKEEWMPGDAPSDFLTLDNLHDLIRTGAMPLAPVQVAAPKLDQAGGFPVLDAQAATDRPAQVPPTQPTAQGDAGGAEPMRALASEVVNLMLDGMARDARMLPGVMSLIRQMKPALLRIAADDPRFFVDRSNPARQLLDDIAQRNLSVGAEQAAGFAALRAALEDVVLLLQRTDIRVVSLFETSLDVLAALDRQAVSQAAAPMTDRAVGSLVKAEQRQVLATQVAAEIRKRPDFHHAAPLVQRFLAGPWALVIAHARLNPAPTGETGRVVAEVRFAGVVSDLIWSSRPDAAGTGRARLVRLIPGLMRTLREGLQSIEYEGVAASQFMSRLMALHEAALTGQPAPRWDADAESLAPAAEADDWLPAADELEADVWLRPNEAAETGFMDEPLPTLEHDTDFEDTLPLYAPPERAGRMGADWMSQPMLTLGTWVELRRESGEWVRLRLVWVSPHGLMYLFAGGDAGRTSSMSRRHFEGMRAAQRIRLLATQSLVDDALDTVMHAAVQNTARLGGGRVARSVERQATPAPSGDTQYPDLLPPLA